MTTELLHIFRNNPLGRETLLQSIFFCENVGAALAVYIPRHTKLLMHFENTAVQIDLDNSYLTSSDTALKHVNELIAKREIAAKLLNSDPADASTLPKIQSDFDFMTLPRCISDLSSKIRLGHLGPRVRHIVEFAPFPILITSPAYKEWQNIAVFFGGSTNAINALKLGFRLSRATTKPIDVFTQLEMESRKFYEKMIEDENLKKEMSRRVNTWHVFEQGSFEDNLYQIPHDALVVLGAGNYKPIKGIVFGSKMEKIQSMLPNNLLIAGPNYTEPNTSIPAWFPCL